MNSHIDPCELGSGGRADCWLRRRRRGARAQDGAHGRRRLRASRQDCAPPALGRPRAGPRRHAPAPAPFPQSPPRLLPSLSLSDSHQARKKLRKVWVFGRDERGVPSLSLSLCSLSLSLSLSLSGAQSLCLLCRNRLSLSRHGRVGRVQERRASAQALWRRDRRALGGRSTSNSRRHDRPCALKARDAPPSNEN